MTPLAGYGRLGKDPVRRATAGSGTVAVSTTLNEPIVLTGAVEGEFQVIAELVEVLERKASFGGD